MAFDAGGGLRPFTDDEARELLTDIETMNDLARIVRRIHVIRAGLN
jgi:hypothetical protein